MLHAALTALLALQSASGSPNVAPPSPRSSSSSGGASVINAPSSGEASSNEEAAPAEAAPPSPAAPAATPTPVPRRGAPLPATKASTDRLLVVNKSEDSLSILDAATGKVRATVPVDPGPHEVEVLADGHTAALNTLAKQHQLVKRLERLGFSVTLHPLAA